MLKEILAQKRDELLKGWVDTLLGSYAPDAESFMKRQKDQFANPVGAAINEGTEPLLDGLISGADLEPEVIKTHLDKIIRIRAVQEFTPGQAVSFVFELKKVIRDVLGDDIREKRLDDELLKFEAGIDELILLAFDVYSECREAIYQIRVKELRNMTTRVLGRLNDKLDVREDEADLNGE